MNKMLFSKEHVRDVQPRLSFLSRMNVGGQIYGFVGAVGSINWVRSWHTHFFPAESQPSFTKKYKIRPSLPIRYIFHSAASSKLSKSLQTTHLYVESPGETINMLTFSKRFHPSHLFIIFKCKTANFILYPRWWLYYRRSKR